MKKNSLAPLAAPRNRSKILVEVDSELKMACQGVAKTKRITLREIVQRGLLRELLDLSPDLAKKLIDALK